MARKLPDDFQSPIPHMAPSKSVVDTVFGYFVATGNGVVSLLSGLLASVLILYSGYALYDSFNTQYKAYSSAWELLQYKPEIIEDGEEILTGSGLSEINSDYRAWLTVYDSSIDYPVMQGPDDLYYASHDIYKNPSLTGSIYLAAANAGDFSDSYSLMYGHHMDNGAMFGRLDDYRDGSYFNSHREGVIITESGAYDITFFAVADTDAYESKIYTVGDRAEDVIDFLTSAPVGTELPGGVGAGSMVYHYDPSVAEGAEKIIALSTCANATTSGRLVVFGKLTPRVPIEVTIEDYTGVYDGEPHTIIVTPSIEEGTIIEYSVDGGVTWTTDPPTVTDVGFVPIVVRVSTERHGTVIAHGSITITAATMTVTAPDVTATYDGLPYYTTGTPSVTEGTTVEYSTDNGNTWSTVRPEFTEVGVYHVYVRATNPNYETAYAVATITIKPAPVKLTFVKKWENDKPEDRPAVLRVVLMGGPQAELFTLTAANNWTATKTLTTSGEYYWIEPDTPGYKQTAVSTVNYVTTVTNTRIDTDTSSEYTLTIKYRYEDGREAAPTYTGTYHPGDEYSVTSPDVPGYKPVISVVTGTMPSRNVVVTVLYVPADTPNEIIDETGKPTGLKDAFINTGDCFE